MKLLLFGAGASYGSDNSGTPPIGANLFEALRAFNPLGWGQLPSPLASVFHRDFEHGMAELAQTNSHAMPVLQRAMAAFFFKYQPRSSSLYVELAQRMRRDNWAGVIGTLNYERLLEISLSHAGIQPVVGQAAKGDQVELCLPHGCCHLFCEGVRMSPVGVSFSGVGVSIDGPVTVVADPAQFAAHINGDAVPPVMCYFEPKKTTSAGASFIRGQRERWSELVASADIVAIVGVKVRPDEDHIWGPLGRSGAKLVYCAGPAAAKKFLEWETASRPNAEDVVLDGSFADEFNSICTYIGLG